RRVRAPGDVGRDRLPPCPDARVARGERGRRAAALPPPPSPGLQPEGGLARTGPGPPRAGIHGGLPPPLPPGGCLPPAAGPSPVREPGHALGLLLERSARRTPLRRRGVPALPPPLPAPGPPGGEAGGHPEDQPGAGGELGSSPRRESEGGQCLSGGARS